MTSPVLAHLPTLERALVAAGFPAMSAWWRERVERFYTSGRRQLVLRVGRRGGKSSTLCRIAVLEALFGEHVIPPGDLGVVAIVSVSRDEGSQRLRTIRAILDALKVGYRPIDGGIELVDRPVGFKVFTASIAGVSGFTAIAVIADEVAKWKDAETGANPAREVLASLRPTMATQPRARIFLSSSPLGSEDAHASAFDQGETVFQIVAYAPTWIAHPAVTEASTHELEPDDRKWRREYLAEPQAGALAAFDSELVDRAIGADVERYYMPCASALLLDPSGGGADSYTWCCARWLVAPEHARFLTRRVWVAGAREHVPVYERDVDGKKIPNPEWREQAASKLQIFRVEGEANVLRRGITSSQIVRHVVGVARAEGAVVAHADQFERYGMQSAFAQHGLTYVAHSWTAPLKERAVERVRGWLRDGVLVLPAHDRLKQELHSFEERIAPSGALTFRGRQGGHDDFAMLVMLAALVDIEGQLPGSPLAPRRPPPLPSNLIA